MALSQSHLDRLDEMIASGVLSSGHGDKRISYRSMAELKEARAHVAAQLAASSTKPRQWTRRTSFSRGDS